MAFYTIGHSNRPASSFLELLRENEIQTLIDVRRFPHSRRYPHFDGAALKTALSECGIGYAHWEALGGRRPVTADSPNSGWRVAGFRGYADYMATKEFQAAFERFLDAGRQQRIAVMCAEAVPWQCHRQLISDALTARGETVLHILGPGQTREHTLTSFAVIDGSGVLSYPPEQGELKL